MKYRKFFFLVFIIFIPKFLSAQQTQYPKRIGWLNMKDYGAIGNGVFDNTNIIRQAISNYPYQYQTKIVLYFPDGVYLVSDSIKYLDGYWDYGVTLQGQSTDNTIIRLKNNANGFNNPAKPKPLFYTRSGNQSFNQYIFSMTINTGNGNSGAVALDYITSNNGTIKDVKIISGDNTGYCGLRMERGWPGPGLIKNVTISGFDYGIRMAASEYSMTFEHLTLLNQNKTGFVNAGNIASIRDLVSQSSRPVVDNSGVFVVVDGKFTGGASDTSALINTGTLFVRNASTAGYGSIIKNNNEKLTTNFITEYASKSPQTLFPSKGISLNLPVKETPDYINNDTTQWANANAYGAAPCDLFYSSCNNATSLRNAFRSGKPIVYFQTFNGSNGSCYNFSDTVSIPASVKKITGFDYASICGQGSAKLIIKDYSPDPLILERIGLPDIENRTNRTVVIKYTGGGNYTNTASANGDVFYEDVVSSFTPQFKTNFYARQYNPEVQPNNLLQSYNNGGLFWILGMKTEGRAPQTKTINGGYTEILGGLMYPASSFSASDTAAAYESVNGCISAVQSMSSYVANGIYPVMARETRNGVTKKLLIQDVTWNTVFYKGGCSQPNLYTAITYPLNQASFSQGVPIPVFTDIESNASPLSIVGLYIDNVIQQTKLAYPFSFTVSGLTIGDHNIYIEAIDQLGNKQKSQQVFLKILQGSGCPNSGTISIERWKNVTTSGINTATMLTPPSESANIAILEGKLNDGDNYISRFRGYICPPTSGNYQFYIAADDIAELWLSTNQNPSNKIRIAYVPDWTNYREFTKYGSQTSALISLTSGLTYYIEAVARENGGGDNLTVAWKLPNGTVETPIPGGRLLPFSLISVSSANLSYTSAGGSQILTVSGNLSWNTFSEQPWLSFSPSSGNGNTTASILVAPNNTSNSRVASITFLSGAIVKTITITQTGASLSPFTWQSLNEPGSGGAITDLAISPYNPNLMLIAGDMLGVGISTDSGKTWQPTYGFKSYEIAEFTFHPSNPLEIWAATMSGPYKSTDGGFNWQEMRSGFPALSGYYTAPIQKILFDPNNSSRLLAFGGSHRGWSSPGSPLWGAVWQSTDGGNNWTNIAQIGSSIFPGITSAVFAGVNSNILYAAAKGQGLYKSTNGGTTWSLTMNGFPASANSFNCLAAHPSDENRIYVSLNAYQNAGNNMPGGIYTTTNGGVNWFGINNGLTQNSNGTWGLNSSYDVVKLSRSNPNVLYTSDLSWWPTGVFKTTNNGQSWTTIIDNGIKNNIPTAYIPAPGMNAMAIDPNNANTMICGNSEYVLKTTNGGTTWKDITSDRVGTNPDRWIGRGFSGLVCRNFKFNPTNPNHAVFTGMDDAKFWQSKDNMQSWSWGGNGFNHWEGGTDVAFAGTSGQVMYVTMGQGFFGGIAKTTDGGANWVNFENNGLPARYSGNEEGKGIYALPNTPNTVWAVVGQKLYQSTNGGTSWTIVLDRPGLTWISAEKANPSTFYVTGSEGVFKTTNGTVFNLMAGSPTNATRILVDPFDDNTLYTTVWRQSNGGLWRFKNNTWTQLRNDQFIYDVDVDPNNSSRLVVSTADDPYHDATYATGVYVSEDNGTTWSQFNDGLPVLRGLVSKFNPQNSNQIIFGTSGRGFFKGSKTTPIVYNLSASNNSLVYASSGGPMVITVSGNMNWTVLTAQPWLTVSSAKGTGTKVLTVSALNFTGTGTRLTQLTILGVLGNSQFINVTQTGAVAVLTISSNLVTYQASGSIQNVSVTSNLNWSVSGLPTWITVSTTNGYGNGVISINTQTNSLITHRSYTFTISGSGLTQFINITQTGAAIVLGNRYYVDATNGNDGYDGLTTTTPWKTINKVNSMMSLFNPGDSILFKSGDNFYGSLNITKSGNINLPIIFSAYGTGDKPLFLGSQTIIGWTNSGGDIWTSNPGLVIEELFMNDVRQTPARFPNKGYLTIEASSGTSSITNSLLGIFNWTGSKVVVRQQNDYIPRGIVISQSGNTINVTLPGASSFPVGNGFYLDHSLNALDIAGEWYQDPSTNLITIKMPNGVNPNTQQLEGSFLNYGIYGDYKSYINISNIQFKYYKNAGISITSTRGSKILNCSFKNILGNGIVYRGEWTNDIYTSPSTDGLIDSCSFYDIQSGAINVAFMRNMTVTRNFAKRIALAPGYELDAMNAGFGFSINQTYITNISYNRIDSTGYSSLSWGGEGNSIFRNEFSNHGLSKNDNGFMQTWGGFTKNNKVYENILHDGFGNQEGLKNASTTYASNSNLRGASEGIYFDDFTQNNTITGNTIYNSSKGIFVQSSRDFVIKDNTVYNCEAYGIFINEKNLADPFTESTLGWSRAVSDINILNNKVCALRASPLNRNMCMTWSSYTCNSLIDFGVSDSNYFFNPYKNELLIRTTLNCSNNIGVEKLYSILTWNTVTNQDLHSKTNSFRWNEFIISTTGTNLITNGTFDTNINNWGSYGSGTISWENNISLNGGSLKATQTSGTGPTYEIQSPVIAVQAGKVYVVSFSALANRNTYLNPVIVTKYPNFNYVFNPGNFIAKTQKYDYQFVFTAPSPLLSGANYGLHFNTQSTGDTIWIDNVSALEVTSLQPDDYLNRSKLFVNNQINTQSFSLGANIYTDLDGNTVTGSITLQPYSSKILILNSVSNESLSSNPMSLNLTSGGAIQSITITSNIAWNIAKNQTWLSLSTIGGVGNVIIVVTVSSNLSTSDRISFITVSGGNLFNIITITQTGAASSLVASPTTLNYTDTGNSQIISVTSNVNWNVISSQPWLTLTGGSGTNNGTITATAEANTATGIRTAQVTIAGGALTQIINITQSGAAASLTANPTTLNYVSTSSTRAISITSNVSWTSTSSQPWLTLTGGSGTNNGTISATAAANTATGIRTAQITVTGGALTQIINITQSGAAASLTANPTTLTYVSTSSTQAISITSNVSWTSTSSQPWLTLTGGGGTNNGTVSATAAANTATGIRTAQVTVTGGALTQI
ncbi:MAG: BACON domain-containing carbohydrate-binding protein, partial [Bacteroidota bacterium]|nr:BACON domain-containing carbohydrate-binding protein [Bacteroidota bacterium]